MKNITLSLSEHISAILIIGYLHDCNHVLVLFGSFCNFIDNFVHFW
jgi:hypothetical protein